MLSVPVNKDVSQFKAKKAGFRPRTFWSFIAALICAAIAVLFLMFVVQIEPGSTIGLLVIAIAAIPALAFGFWKDLPTNTTGLEFEEWLPLWMEHTLSKGVQQSFYAAPCHKQGLIENPYEPETKLNAEWQAIKDIKGLELYRPTDELLGTEGERP